MGEERERRERRERSSSYSTLFSFSPSPLFLARGTSCETRLGFQFGPTLEPGPTIKISGFAGRIASYNLKKPTLLPPPGLGDTCTL